MSPSYNLWVTLWAKKFFIHSILHSVKDFAFHQLNLLTCNWACTLVIYRLLQNSFRCEPKWQTLLYWQLSHLSCGEWILLVPKIRLILGEYLLFSPELQCCRVLEDTSLTRKCSQSNCNSLLCIPRLLFLSVFSKLSNHISFNCPWQAMFPQALIILVTLLLTCQLLPSFSNYSISDERQDSCCGHGRKVRVTSCLA